MIGSKLGPYELLEELGRGGMATVYRAYQPNTDRFVAVKVIHRSVATDSKGLERFTREARLVAKLEHPHILPVYDYNGLNDPPYIVMRYLPSGTLKDILEREKLPREEVMYLMSQISSALDYAHRQNIIHRDIKPSNIMVDQDGNAFLTDFGIARMMEGGVGLTGTGMTVGTPGYMAPEQGLGQAVDSRADIYSLGVMLYEMLVGKVPYSGETPMAVILRHINEPVPDINDVDPNLPRAVSKVISKAMAKSVEDRYDSASELSKALSTALGTPQHLTPGRLQAAASQTIIELQKARKEAADSLIISMETPSGTSHVSGGTGGTGGSGTTGQGAHTANMSPNNTGTITLSRQVMQGAFAGIAVFIVLLLVLGGIILFINNHNSADSTATFVAAAQTDISNRTQIAIAAAETATAQPTSTSTPSDTVVPPPAPPTVIPVVVAAATASATDTSTDTSEPPTDTIAASVTDTVAVSTDTTSPSDTLEPATDSGNSTQVALASTDTNTGKPATQTPVELEVTSAVDTSVPPSDTEAVQVALAASSTSTVIPPTDTPSDTETYTVVPPTYTPQPTYTFLPTYTLVPTDTPSNTPTDTPLPTDTATFTPSTTPLPTDTPTNTPTDTLTPSDTPTNTPTDTLTPTLTPTDTLTPTLTPTLVPTTTATPAPTEVAIVPTAASSASDPAILLSGKLPYVNDMEDSHALDGWDYDPNAWSLESDSGNVSLLGSGDFHSVAIPLKGKSPDWAKPDATNLLISTNINLDAGNSIARMIFRYSDSGYYLVEIDQGRIYIKRGKTGEFTHVGDERILAQIATTNIVAGNWYLVEIWSDTSRVYVYIDHKLALSAEDTQGALPGGPILLQNYNKNFKSHFDNLKVQLPLPASEHFEEANWPSTWNRTSDTSAKLASGQNNSYIDVTSGDVAPINPPVAALQLTFRLYSAQGGLDIHLQESAAGSYVLQFVAGDMTLNQVDTLGKVTLIHKFPSFYGRNEWLDFRIETVGNEFRIYSSHTEFDTALANPLPAGTVRFTAHTGDEFYLDDCLFMETADAASESASWAFEKIAEVEARPVHTLLTEWYDKFDEKFRTKDWWDGGVNAPGNIITNAADKVHPNYLEMTYQQGASWRIFRYVKEFYVFGLGQDTNTYFDSSDIYLRVNVRVPNAGTAWIAARTTLSAGKSSLDGYRLELTKHDDGTYTIAAKGYSLAGEPVFYDGPLPPPEDGSTSDWAQLLIVCFQNKVAFFANGRLLGSTSSANLLSGTVALGVEPNSVGDFDDFQLRDVSPETR